VQECQRTTEARARRSRVFKVHGYWRETVRLAHGEIGQAAIDRSGHFAGLTVTFRVLSPIDGGRSSGFQRSRLQKIGQVIVSEEASMVDESKLNDLLVKC
jgi:hypothetical protein